MKTKCLLVGALAVFILASGAVLADDLEVLTTLIDSTRAVEADVFSPKAYAKAERAFNKAQETSRTGKKQKIIDKYITESSEYAENALKATELAKLTLAEYLAPRNKAKEAGAPGHVPELWRKAELQFIKGCDKIEGGNVKSGLKEADKAESLYDTAEMEAIRKEIMGDADALIKKAVADEATKYALATLDKARKAMADADRVLLGDRYEREESVVAATLAEYEARHASSIAKSVRTLQRNDQAWERLMLVYEIQMNRIGESLGLTGLPFDMGPLAAADSAVAMIEAMKSGGADLDTEIDAIGEKLRATLEKAGVSSEASNVAGLAGEIDNTVVKLLSERDDMTSDMAQRQEELAILEKEHESVAGELDKRLEKEQKIKTARSTLNPSECEVVLSPSDDVVMRLFGLSFDVGSSDIKDNHVPLLAKVEKIIEMFPESKLLVEGHTDNLGDLTTNRRLSENRAIAVMQYLRQSLSMPAERIQSSGYGPDKPIASNQTKEGRAKNRRIDIIILQ
ncbi:MAG: OmpA family protein [FCB group bacterium]|nr:OmpA family protein [FCB group bacterium]